MRDHVDGTTPHAPTQPSLPEGRPEDSGLREVSGSPLVPTHVFQRDYLRLLADRDEPSTSTEADVVGPWHLERAAYGHAVLREGESLRRGDRPTAVFTVEDAARLCAAVLPATGRGWRYHLRVHPEPDGYPIVRDDELIGYMPIYNAGLMDALNVADALISSPDAFAWLLDAAGGLLLDHAGKIALDRALA